MFVKYVLKSFGMFPKEVTLIDVLVKGDPKSCVVDLEKYRQSLVALDRPQP